MVILYATVNYQLLLFCRYDPDNAAAGFNLCYRALPHHELTVELRQMHLELQQGEFLVHIDLAPGPPGQVRKVFRSY